MSGSAKVGTSSPNYSNTDVVYLRVNTDGALLTTSTDTAGGGTASIDKGSFTEGTTKGTPAMGAYLDTLAALTPGVVAIQRLTPYRAGHVNLRNASGAEIGTVAAPISQAAADGSSVALGATTDEAIFTDAVGTLNAHVRGLVKLLAAVTSLGSSWIQVSIQNATLAVTQSGAWVLSAGSALIGKVSIDQTTPGTTNGVQTLTGSTTAVTGTVAVSAASLPLPSGASTSAAQTTGNNSVASIDTKTPALGQALAAASVPIVLTAAQLTTLTPPATQTVTQATGANLHTVVDSGTITAVTAITNALPVGANVIGKVSIDQTTPGTTNKVSIGTDGTVAVSGTVPVSAVSLPLPAGAATAAKQPAIGVAGTASADVLTVQGAASMTALKVDGSAVTQPVSGAFFQGTQPVSGTVTTTPPANASSNIAQIGGTAVDTNSGLKSAGTIRVVLATDQPANTTALKVDGSAVTQPVSAASLPLPTGASTAAKQPSLGTAGAASADVLTIQGIASMTALKVDPSAVTSPVSLSTIPALVAGSAVVGKVGIDQTTPGTTNGVQVVAALPAGTAIIGKTGIDQTTPGTTNKVNIGTDGTVAIGTALPAGTALIGKVGIDQTTPGTTNAVQTLSGSTTAVTGNVTVVQPTGTSLHAVLDTTSTTAVTQATGSNLHAVIDSGVITTVSAVTAITNALPVGANVIGKVSIDQTALGTTNAVQTLTGSTTAVTQATGTNLHAVVDSGTITTVSTVTALTAITNALPTGANTIGSVRITDGTTTAVVNSAAIQAAATANGAQVIEKGPRWRVTSTPAVSTVASAVKAAGGAGVRHVCDSISFSAAATTAPALTKLNINVRDGAAGTGTIIWSYTVVIAAATGQSVQPHSITGLNLVGTAATAMTIEFSALLTNLFEDVSISGYDVS